VVEARIPLAQVVEQVNPRLREAPPAVVGRDEHLVAAREHRAQEAPEHVVVVDAP
jgi:hypothetical protein